MSKIIIHADGGSRGNPGPSAIGVVIDLGLRGVKEYGNYLGIKTNNQAEYEAIIFALKKLKSLIGSGPARKTSVMVYMDSELVVSQLAGQYKIKEPDLYPLFIGVWNARHDFALVDFIAVPRGKNQQADRLVNQALDSAGSKK